MVWVPTSPSRRRIFVALFDRINVRIGASNPAREALMRSPILSFVVLIAALLGKIQAASAQSPASYPWCARFFGGELVGATSCYFTSKEQCMTTLSGIGGYCYESPYYHRSAPRNAPRGRRRTGWRLREGR